MNDIYKNCNNTQNVIERTKSIFIFATILSKIICYEQYYRGRTYWK